MFNAQLKLKNANFLHNIHITIYRICVSTTYHHSYVHMLSVCMLYTYLIHTQQMRFLFILFEFHFFFLKTEEEE